ncbi:MAG: antibiotic biosynthesis monooxygenase family protein [Candidatus Baltobacteraceae bacterium]
MIFKEMSNAVSVRQQMQHDDGPVVLINVFTVDPDQSEELLEVWATNASFMKSQPGFISTQLHRGIANSGVFVNYAVWESVDFYRNAFTKPEFQALLDDHPASTVASAHLFKKVGVPGICVS